MSDVESDEAPPQGNVLEMLTSLMTAVSATNEKLNSIDTRILNLENGTPSNSGKKKPKSAKKSSSSGSSDEDSENFSDDEFDERLPKTPKARRGSVLGRTTESAEKDSVRLVMQGQQPKFDHIFLKYTSVKQIFQFWESANEYQIAYKIQLPLTTLVDKKIRARLLAKDRKLSERKYFALSNKSLYSKLKKLIQPNTRVEFQEKLEKNVEFNLRPNYKPTPSDFRPFYDALLEYRNDFLKVYELLAEDNEENVPECKNFDGGLISSFLKKIPFEYGNRLFKTLKNKETIKTIYEFLNQFYLTVEYHHDCHMQAVALLQAFGGTDWLTKKVDRAISNIEDLDGDLNAIHEEYFGVYDESDAEMDESLAAMQATPAKDPLVCFTKLLHGTCSKADCKYSHKEDLVTKTRARYIEMMSKLQSSPAKVSLLPRPKPTSHVPTPLSHSNITLIEPLASVEPSSDLVVDAADDLLQVREDLFLANMSAQWFIRCIHRKGQVHTDQGDFDVEDVLFDSGATTASYISEDIVRQHGGLLEPYLEPVRGSVKLAAKDHSVSIRHRALLDVTFIDNNDNEHRAKIRFYVLPESSNSMVIGLPAIIAHFGKLFIGMIESAIEQYNGEPSHQLHSIEGEDPPIGEYELRDPWSLPPLEEAPEDLETELPCSFTDALHFMEMSYEDAKLEYFSQIDEHVSEEFRNATPVVELLKTVGVQAFVPSSWEGVKGVEPLELKWKADLPERMKPKARPVNPRLYENAHKEYQRLLEYMYVPSHSPIASCLVIAPKATKPFIRFCGDYVQINKYIETGHYPIPHVQRSLEKIASYLVFLDIDLVNAFHQVPLAPLTSERLSVQTPWGQVAPKFMPEGIAPATFVLQETISNIFREFDEWIIAIYDNLLVLAHDFDDAYRKLELVLQKCIQHNLYLKFSKSWLGFRKVNFFGYVCSQHGYELSDDRKKKMEEYQPPQTLKQLQSFLGASLYFKPFVAHFSTLAAPLYDMTKNDTVWNTSTWTAERIAAFDAFKLALIKSGSIHYPDYSLRWVLITDASQEGVGIVLLQIYQPTPESEPQYQVILYDSQKFSEQAKKWLTIEQECYGNYWGVKRSSYYVRGKEFELWTDHRNNIWIEQSTVPKIIRWRVYMQSFNFKVRHIPGKQNLFADWLSRSFQNAEDSPPAAPAVETQALAGLEDSADPAEAAVEGAAEVPQTSENLLAKVHGGRMGHNGARKTWISLNERFPGHRIPYRVVEDFISRCAICQKDRLGMYDALTPVYRTLKHGNKRKSVGVDTLTVTPVDKYGNQYINVVVVHATKLIALYPSAQKTAMDMATALFKFFSTYGVYEELVSDPGSDLMSEVVQHLTLWYGTRHIFSLVDRHESNGVEGTNKSVLRHLKAIVHDERIVDRWSDPTVICLVQFMLNSQVSLETGLSPFHAHFGTDDSTYFKLPEAATASETAHEFVRLLDDNLRTLWEISKDYQLSLLEKRGATKDPALQNQYQPGDLVLFQRSASVPLPSKLTLRYMGPYEVISQYKNDVQCRHLCVKTTHTFHVERLKMFYGSRADAEKAAQLDHDQHEIAEILYYRGNPEIRTTMEFFIRFADGEERWVTWNKDLFDTVQYEAFCRAHPPLFPLIFTVKEAQRRIAEINATAITEVTPGQKVYVDLRSRGGATWYNALGLPNAEKTVYVLHCEYGRWIGRNKRKIMLTCAVTNEEFAVDHYFVRSYGCCSVFSPEAMVLVDRALCKKHPKIMPH